MRERKPAAAGGPRKIRTDLMKKTGFWIPHSHTFEKLAAAVLLLVAIVALGTLAYEVTEGLELLDALYATLNTVTTVGRSMADFSPEGKIVSMVIMVLGIVTGTLVLGLVTRAMLEGHLRTLVGRRRMEKQVSKLKGHVILCGYGRMGKVIARELARQGASFVIVEHDEAVFGEIESDGYVGFFGDAASDENLLRCGIERARALIAVTASDADNVFVTLSARQLNPGIYIVARASDDTTIEKLKKAGADRVFSPYRISGRQMAFAALRPNVIDFLSEIGGAPGSENYQIEELWVEPGAPVCGKSLRELNLSRNFGVIVIGLRRKGGPMQYNPSAETVLEGDDILIAIAPTSRLSKLNELVSAKG